MNHSQSRQRTIRTRYARQPRRASRSASDTRLVACRRRRLASRRQSSRCSFWSIDTLAPRDRAGTSARSRFCGPSPPGGRRWRWRMRWRYVADQRPAASVVSIGRRGHVSGWLRWTETSRTPLIQPEHCLMWRFILERPLAECRRARECAGTSSTDLAAGLGWPAGLPRGFLRGRPPGPAGADCSARPAPPCRRPATGGDLDDRHVAPPPVATRACRDGYGRWRTARHPRGRDVSSRRAASADAARRGLSGRGR